MTASNLLVDILVQLFLNLAPCVMVRWHIDKKHKEGNQTSVVTTIWLEKMVSVTQDGMQQRDPMWPQLTQQNPVKTALNNAIRVGTKP